MKAAPVRLEEKISDLKPKKILLPLLLAILLIVAFLGGYFFLYRSSKLLPSSPKTLSITCPVTPSDTLNWKDYQDDKLGFSVKYPPEFRVRRPGLSGPGVTFQSSKIAGEGFSVSFSRNPGVIDINNFNYLQSAEKGKLELPIEISRRLSERNPGVSVMTKISNLNTDGYQAVAVLSDIPGNEGPFVFGPTPPLYNINVYLNKDSTIWEAEGKFYSAEDRQKELPLFNKILCDLSLK